MTTGWIGVDLDGTLAHYDHWRGVDHIGAPIPLMVERVKDWLAEGKDVRIFTARVDGGEVSGQREMRDIGKAKKVIREWCMQHLGRALPITCKKDFGMSMLYDDRCVQVIPNTGKTLVDELEAMRLALEGRKQSCIDGDKSTCAQSMRDIVGAGGDESM